MVILKDDFMCFIVEVKIINLIFVVLGNFLVLVKVENLLGIEFLFIIFKYVKDLFNCWDVM